MSVDGPSGTSAESGIEQQLEWPLHPGTEFGESQTVESETSPKRALGVALVLVVLGVLTGVLWAFITPTAPITVTTGGLSFNGVQSAEIFSGVAVFASLAFGFGLITALLVWFGLPQTRGVSGLAYCTVATLAGSGLAMSAGTSIVDRRFPGVDPHRPGLYPVVGHLWLDDASIWGVPTPWLLLICAPTVAVLVYLFLTVAASRPELRPAPEVPEFGSHAV
ncbi:MAG: DUF2567 domain-containing protein [Gordonia sp. (in: high G+C Gram-positive bacteria)]